MARCYALAPEVKQQIEDLVNNNKLFVFMKGTPEAPMCGFSKAVVQVLEVHGEHQRTYGHTWVVACCLQSE